MSPSQPLFSVIIPSHERPVQLAACLEALAQQTYPTDRFEVTVVDDGSRASLEPVVDRFGARLRVILLRQANAGPAAARNAGGASASGEFLAFTDDDCVPDPGWLWTLASRVTEHPDHLVGGRTLSALPGNPYSVATQSLIDALYTYYDTVPSRLRFFATNNMAMSRSGFQSIGGFDSVYTRAASEDREFCDRWLSCGRSMSYVPEAVVYHAHALTLRGFCRLHFTYGRGAAQFHTARARRNETPVTLESPAFYKHILLYPFTAKTEPPPLLIAVLLMVSQMVHACGCGWERLLPSIPETDSSSPEYGRGRARLTGNIRAFPRHNPGKRGP